MLKQKYFLTDFFILSAEKQPIKLSWRNIEWLRIYWVFITLKIHLYFKRNNSLRERRLLLRLEALFDDFNDVINYINEKQ